MSQEGFLKDLLRRREVRGRELSPMPRIEDAEDEEEVSSSCLKEAQGLVGELMWLSRSRPDAAYAIGVLSRLMHRRPRAVVQWGMHVLRYLNATTDYKLHYKAVRSTGWEHLKKEWSEKSMEIYADTSFAPPHEKYRSIQGILVQQQGNPILWESSRQSFVTQSTAEGELVGYNEAYQAGESVAALMKCFDAFPEKILYGDNRAALTQCTGETGAWRTRHLRLRSAKLREALREDPCSGWTAEHLKGGLLVADGLTKPLVGQAFEGFRKMLGMAGERPGKNSRREDGKATEAEKSTEVEKATEAEKSTETEKATEAEKSTETEREEGQLKARTQGQLNKIAGSLAAIGGVLIAVKRFTAGTAVLACAAALKGYQRSREKEGKAVDLMPRVRALRRNKVDERQLPVSPGSEAARWLGSDGHEEGAEEALWEFIDDEAGGRVPNQWSPTEEDDPGQGATYVRREWRVEEPWKDQEFSRPKTSSADRWNMEWWTRGWLIREQRRPRKRPIKLENMNVPCERSQLTGERATVIFRDGEQTECLFEDDSCQSSWESKVEWRGYTFLKRAIGSEASSSGRRP